MFVAGTPRAWRCHCRPRNVASRRPPETIAHARKRRALFCASAQDAGRGGKELWPKSKLLLDVRDAVAFERCHVANAVSFPLRELEQRAFELPPPYTPARIVICGESIAQVEHAVLFLTAKGWQCDVRECLLLGTDEASAFSRFKTETGRCTAVVWRPNEFLEQLFSSGPLPLSAYLRAEQQKLTEAPVALDLGCGSGRDLVFLKMHLPGRWRVMGFDNHSYALERAKALAQRASVDVEVCTVDLTDELQAARLPKAHLVHGCRFLHRPLLRHVRDHVIHVGGIFIWSTFVQSAESARNMAPPYKEKRVLAPGELREMFLVPSLHVQYELIEERDGVFLTRGVPVPATFFACRRVR
ncbi:hypothetical protein FVE85_0613 [Porphyridium purpureum]|uniref:Rhodanese domain-containing protein n=1 Tax=Porphyridium purpureum TaxID=35688 RepID=A0A5J4Z1S4_PORPP|nr:hypothetical protein FVE85_0613 [Porphyridium purpureum]|eukprot:POR0696..scf208_2